MLLVRVELEEVSLQSQSNLNRANIKDKIAQSYRKALLKDQIAQSNYRKNRIALSRSSLLKWPNRLVR